MADAMDHILGLIPDPPDPPLVNSNPPPPPAPPAPDDEVVAGGANPSPCPAPVAQFIGNGGQAVAAVSDSAVRSSAPTSRMQPPSGGSLDVSASAAAQQGMSHREWLGYVTNILIVSAAAVAGLTIDSPIVAAWLLLHLRPASLAARLATQLTADHAGSIPSAEWLLTWLCNELACQEVTPLYTAIRQLRSVKAHSFGSLSSLLEWVYELKRQLPADMPDKFYIGVVYDLLPRQLQHFVAFRIVNGRNVAWEAWNDFVACLQLHVHLWASPSSSSDPSASVPGKRKPPSSAPSSGAGPSGPSTAKKFKAPELPVSQRRQDYQSGDSLFVQGLGQSERDSLRKAGKCLLCKQSKHVASECPKREELYKKGAYFFYKK